MNTERAVGEGVRVQVEAIRKKLLDLSLRNRMLNYRASKRLGVAVAGESSFQVHRLLVEESKQMSFKGRPDPPRKKSGDAEPFDFGDDVALDEFRKAAEEELDAFLSYAPAPVDQIDTKLNTEEFESILQAKLRSILREATLANDELGINTLFLTLGTLEWCENQERSYRAPLIFIPVTLKQQPNGAIRLIHDGSDIGTNLPLRAKLAEFNFKLPDLAEDDTILGYVAKVESTIRSRQDWTVHRDEICLGFFNYEKYAMYVDLGGESWPVERKPWLDEDLVSMLSESYQPAESPIHDKSFIDDFRPTKECHEVYDADSSQTLAMIRAASGLSMVIEGPPGTGKSQTITNIIAEAVAANKTVLFVSAKRAALDVVKRRLVEADLGDIALDLHDKLTNRREFYGEIKRTVGMHLHVPEQEERVNRLTELRDRLNLHSKAINEPLEPFGVTPFTAMSILASLPKETIEDRDGRIPFEQLRHLTANSINALKQTVGTLQRKIEESGLPAEQPFFGAEISYIDPAIRLDLREQITEARAALLESFQKLASVAELFKIPMPVSIQDVGFLRACGERALSAPALDGVAIKTGSWAAQESDIRHVIAQLRERVEVLSNRRNHVISDAWAVDPTTLILAYNLHQGKWYRFLIGEFRKARKETQLLLTQSGPSDSSGQLALLADLQKVRFAESLVRDKQVELGRLFGVQWQGFESDADLLERLLDWILSLHRDVSDGKLPSGFIDFLSGTHSDADFVQLVAEAESAAERVVSKYQALCGTLKFPSESCRVEAIEQIDKRVDGWEVALPRLADYIALMGSRKSAIEKGLAAVVETADRWPHASTRLIDAFVRSYYTGVVREGMEVRPELKTFERTTHEAAISEFRSLDDFKLRYNRAQVRLIHHRNIPRFDNAAGNLHLLKMQCELQRKHKPIRWTMSRAGAAIQRIKPVFMMSPLSVAIHLPPELPSFDLVIFDEASQVKPEDALCAIVRAKQTVVVGDTRQMPPTSFFDRVADDELEDEGDSTTEVAREAAKLESVLSLMSAAANSEVRRPDLQWHYRSLHPSLIQPSNELFYENRLIIFPSPGTESNGHKVGIVFHHHPETVYEGGDRKRFNRLEAEIVAKAVLDHISTSPKQSLMVAAMNKSQADLIYAEVQKQERLHPEPFQAFRSQHPYEPLEVKNLENVQGDERDIVYISVTYGRDAAGIIRQQFGPLLRDGGERRLNVLITRARMRCEVFTNITADDLRVEPGQRGLVAFKRYLNFAQSGRIAIPLATGMGEESPFEEEVSAVLRDLGYKVDTQVGSEGCRIDLAIVDSENPGRYILGVECDGASYHSSRSARDRDKLRQSILEARGWTLHRIWSTDWWQDRDAEIVRLTSAITEASASNIGTGLPVIDRLVESLIEQRLEPPERPRNARPYLQTPHDLPITNESDLRLYLIRVVSYEGPITHDLLTIRLRDAAGYAQTGRNIRSWFDSMIAEAAIAKHIFRVGSAYLLDNSQLNVVRDWSERPNSERRLDLVADIEVSAALRSVIQEAFGISEEEAVKRAFSLLGFKRASEDTKARGMMVLAAMLAEGSIATESGLLVAQKK